MRAFPKADGAVLRRASAGPAVTSGDNGVETPLAGVPDKAGASPVTTIPQEWGWGIEIVPQ